MDNQQADIAHTAETLRLFQSGDRTAAYQHFVDGDPEYADRTTSFRDFVNGMKRIAAISADIDAMHAADRPQWTPKSARQRVGGTIGT